MTLYWNNRRQSTLNVVALFAFAVLASCTLDETSASSQQEEPASKGKGKTRQSSSRDASADDDALDGSADMRVSTRAQQRDASSAGGEPETPKKQAKQADAATKSEEPDKADDSAPDAGNSPDDADKPTEMEPPKADGDAECTRMRLKEKSVDYLKSMASGDTMALLTHPSFRYTENGREEELGTGVWLRRSETQFSRTVVDETLCSTFTQAVMDGATGRFSFGVRLRYAEGQLLEAEAQFAPELLADTDLDALIPMGDDTFVAEVPMDKRMSRDELFDFAHRYFDSVTGAASLPPSAPDCRRLQNGKPLGEGTCTEPPGTMRFEQQRFDLADELNGIVTATVLYDGFLGFYLLRMSDKVLQDIQVIGGASSQATGW